jgi:hypothetical protein
MLPSISYNRIMPKLRYFYDKEPHLPSPYYNLFSYLDVLFRWGCLQPFQCIRLSALNSKPFNIYLISTHFHIIVPCMRFHSWWSSAKPPQPNTKITFLRLNYQAILTNGTLKVQHHHKTQHSTIQAHFAYLM